MRKIDKIKNMDKVNLLTENRYITNHSLITEDKTLSSKIVFNMAKNAGNFVIDAESALKDLIVDYGEKTPLSRVKEILANFDLEIGDVKHKYIP